MCIWNDREDILPGQGCAEWDEKELAGTCGDRQNESQLALLYFNSLLLFEEETVFYSCQVSGCRLYPVPWVGNAFSTKLMSRVWVPDLTLRHMLVPLTFIASRVMNNKHETLISRRSNVRKVLELFS